jgi:transposase-like protein
VRYRDAPQAPPFCPNPQCRFHRHDRHLWRYVRAGFFLRQATPHRIQRFRCDTCCRYFSTQTFRPDYWLKRPDLLPPLFHLLVACSGFRQIARAWRVSPQTVLRLTARLGRHCLLFHEHHRLRGVLLEPLVLDSFQSFEHSQYWPTLFHTLVGQRSHFVYGFTESECRRSGRMTAFQRRKRTLLERQLGRPDPRSIEKEVAHLFSLVVSQPQPLVLHSDEHQDYPRALQRLPFLQVDHRTVSSRAARTPQNPLFPLNLLDLLIRHSSANHKRETIAFSKRRQSAIERLWVFVVWRNWMKPFSERKRDATPAMRLGLVGRPKAVEELLRERYFVTRSRLPERWQDYYWRKTQTRAIPRCAVHKRRYAA